MTSLIESKIFPFDNKQTFFPFSLCDNKKISKEFPRKTVVICACKLIYFHENINRNKEHKILGGNTGCVNSICYTLNAYLAIKNALLSNKNGICTFMRCGHLTYDPWVWLKITSLSSTASVLNDGRISLDIPSFCSEIFFFKTSK